MKRLLPLLALLLLLGGCTRQSDAPTASGSAPPSASNAATPKVAPPPSPTPTPTPEKSWWEGRTAARLPTEVPPVGTIASLDGPVCLALLPEADIGLYGDPDPTLGILLRKGDVLQFFPQTYATARYTLPELTWGDPDDDGEKELTVKYLVSDLDGSIVYELHIYEWDGEQWLDQGFTPQVYLPLLEETLVSRCEGNTVKLSAGTDATTIRYSGDKGLTGLADPGQLVFFRKEGGRLKVIFGLRLALSDGSSYDAATLTATLTYDGTQFSMSNYSLEQVGGV